MANQEQLAILYQGVDAWNKWRKENLDNEIDLSEADLSNDNLKGANLKGANLTDATLAYADLRKADLGKAYLWEANLGEANLMGANLGEANLMGANLGEANLMGADLGEANLMGANLSEANLSMSVLSRANLTGAHLAGANFTKANLMGADLSGANLTKANLRKANLTASALEGASFNEADLGEADLRGARLIGAQLISTKVSQAKISGSDVYAINVWDIKGEFAEQKDLVITRPPVPVGKRDEDDMESLVITTEQTRTPIITVDNIKIAQFVYLILNNQEIRNVINTLTSKSVLILGRFALPERKSILDALKDKLREYNLVPIVFDFDRPVDQDFTETIKTLAGLSYFVIADVTNPKSSPLELQATVPDYQIPFVPIVQEGESPFAMMIDLQKKYNWVLNTVSYDSQETLMTALKPLIIDPAMKKRQELRLIKAQEPEIISAKDYLDQGKE